MNEQGTWKAVATGVGVGVAVTLRLLIVRAWTRRRGEAPPTNPADAGTRWREAALFAASTGALVGVVRVATDWIAAGAWRRVTGSSPPGIRSSVGTWRRRPSPRPSS